VRGDAIIVEQHHRRAGRGVTDHILPKLRKTSTRYTLSVAGESGSGKSETAQALAEELGKAGINCTILQQDDYFVYPPRSNDQTRRQDIGWVGPQEVHLDVLDANLQAFHNGATSLVKPLVLYGQDQITEETLDVAGSRVLIAEGTYTTLLENVDARTFIDRSYIDTRAHREKRARHESELDPFIDQVLAIEHRIISAHKIRADLVIAADYTVSIPA
jgi:uridine kinase